VGTYLLLGIGSASTGCVLETAVCEVGRSQNYLLVTNVVELRGKGTPPHVSCSFRIWVSARRTVSLKSMPSSPGTETLTFTLLTLHLWQPNLDFLWPTFAARGMDGGEGVGVRVRVGVSISRDCSSVFLQSRRMVNPPSLYLVINPGYLKSIVIFGFGAGATMSLRVSG